MKRVVGKFGEGWTPWRPPKGLHPPLPYYCWTRWGEDHQRVLQMPQTTRPHQFCWWGFFLRLYGRPEITKRISRNHFNELIIYDFTPKVNTPSYMNWLGELIATHHSWVLIY